MDLEARHRQALAAIARATGPSSRPIEVRRGDTDPGVPYPPSIGPSELSPSSVTDAIEAAGCVRIPSLVTPAVASDLAVGIDEAFAGFDRHGGAPGTGDVWFDAFIPGDDLVHATRPWLREGGGVFTADSPEMASRWFEMVDSLGLLDLVSEIFGERPVTSLDKCALRRISAGDGIEWHQDGSFLGPEFGALNVWLCLSDTERSPGLDIVSRRFTEIVETGTGSAGYEWSTGPEVVAELAERTPIERPRFLPGDGLLFDGLLLHRTSQEPPRLPDTRYAIETWFFRPSHFPPHQQVPIALSST